MPRKPLPLQRSLPLSGSPSLIQRSSDAPSRSSWSRVTLAEFSRQVEREFGASLGPSGIRSTGLTPDEFLRPDTVRAVCEQLGVPPEDFGV